MKTSLLPWWFLSAATFGLVSLLAGEIAPSTAPEVRYPNGYRSWRFITSAVLSPMPAATNGPADAAKLAAPHGLIHNVYANDKAVEGLRTGHFPEGAVLIADWFVLESHGPELLQGPRKSLNVMVRDAHYTATGGWGFEDFDRDSHTTRNVGPKAVTSCFECHGRAKDHEFVFSRLTP